MTGLAGNRTTDAGAGVTPDDRPVVLVVSNGEALGDAITRIPFYRALRTALPDHRVVHLCRRSSSFLGPLKAIADELVDEIRSDEPGLEGLGARSAIRAVGNVDVVLDLRSNLGALWTYAGTMGMGVRYVANAPAFLLRHGIAARPEPRPELIHRRLHRCVELIAGRSLPYEPMLPVRAGSEAAALALLPEGSRFALLSPGTSTSVRAWPTGNWTALAASIAAKGIQPVFLLGPTEDGERAWIERDVKGALVVDPDSVADLTELPWLFHALADRAVASVAVHSGIGHVIATRGVPLLTIVGPTNIERWRPETPHHFEVTAQQFGSRRTADIPLSAVLARTDEMIRSAEEHSRKPAAASVH